MNSARSARIGGLPPPHEFEARGPPHRDLVFSTTRGLTSGRLVISRSPRYLWPPT